MAQIVYASSDDMGLFEELIILNSENIIDDFTETEDGVRICNYVSKGEEKWFFFIDRLDILSID